MSDDRVFLVYVAYGEGSRDKMLKAICASEEIALDQMRQARDAMTSFRLTVYGQECGKWELTRAAQPHTGYVMRSKFNDKIWIAPWILLREVPDERQ